jgi:hypothetical protein
MRLQDVSFSMWSQALNYLSNVFPSLSRAFAMVLNDAKSSLELPSSMHVLLNKSMVQGMGILSKAEA